MAESPTGVFSVTLNIADREAKHGDALQVIGKARQDVRGYGYRAPASIRLGWPDEGLLVRLRALCMFHSEPAGGQVNVLPLQSPHLAST